MEREKPLFVFSFKRKKPIPTRPILIGTTVYRCSADAAKALGVSQTTVINRIKRKAPVDGKIYKYVKKINKGVYKA